MHIEEVPVDMHDGMAESRDVTKADKPVDTEK